MENNLSAFKQVQEFHQVFHPTQNHTPKKLGAEDIYHRVGFKIEELVELLYASSDNDTEKFTLGIKRMHESIDQAVEKIQKQRHIVDNPLVDEVDALIDLLYFTYGTFVLMGVDPTEIFTIVHQANMGKLFPDGKPHYDPITKKVIKPDDWQEKFAPEPRILKELEKQKHWKN